MRTIGIGLICLLAACSAVHAQTTVINPTKVQFTASADHSISIAGVPVVDHYDFNVVIGTPTGALAFTKGLAKPTPDANNLIIVTVPEFLTLSTGAYSASVSAVGPGGASKSNDDPFGRIGPPRAPTAYKAVP